MKPGPWGPVFVFVYCFRALQKAREGLKVRQNHFSCRWGEKNGADGNDYNKKTPRFFLRGVFTFVYYTCFCAVAMISSFGWKPTAWSTTSPSLRKRRVGMLITLCF